MVVRFVEFRFNAEIQVLQLRPASSPPMALGDDSMRPFKHHDSQF
jgi:hypothetical protein